MKTIQLQNVCKSFPGQDHPAVDGVTLTIEKGSVFGLIGRNGSGKSTLAKMLAGILRPTSGDILVDGKKNASETARWQRSRIAYLTQSPLALNTMTVRESLDCFSRLYGANQPKAHREETLERLGLTQHGNQIVRSLSGGQSKLVQLGIAISSERPFVILDEPTNELDAFNRRLVWAEIDRLAKQGTTVLVITHAVSEVESCLTHLGIMHEGHLVVSGTVDEVIQDNRRQRTVTYRTSPESKDEKAVFKQFVNEESVPKVVLDLYNKGVTDITITSANLEDLFVSTVGHKGKA
ncbi:ABC transporter ATP-binding protein [Corynebacterium striatum]|nr:ABC transporter ATP-binding protein [Corynebacterium striatum]MDK8789960.1 ABC transporter ATP-binding protein [Corynebacterium striatum]MDK8809066.1 ABC transporter ATP-binding protein [Corynebacterium striatum]MDK8826951.1 ABC transporter ATP-binding protein [Corynebacterium striatum]